MEAQTQPISGLSGPEAQEDTSKSPAQVDPKLTGTISGTVEDQSGALGQGAAVRLVPNGQADAQEAVSGQNGEYSFAHVPAGPFQLTVTAPGFVSGEISGVLKPGEYYIAPPVVLKISGGNTEVLVAESQVEVAQAQIEEQEKQRVFGIIPNFYTTYEADPAPLNTRQKFQLAWKSTTDPVTIVGAGMIAGFQQAADQFSGYGQGMEGYGKRFGAAYANIFIGTFVGSAVLPSVLKQDPRYYYKGTGSTSSRIAYALANPFICKGDNKRWQANYSSVLGAFATGGISYLYYPASDRNGAGAVMQTAAIRLAESSLAGIFQEFVLRKLTPHMKTHDRGTPQQ
jgi:hypothetical protein